MGLFSRRDAPAGPMPIPTGQDAGATYIRNGDFDLRALVIDLFGASVSESLNMLRDDFELDAEQFYAAAGLDRDWDSQRRATREAALADARAELARVENEDADDAESLQRYYVVDLKAEVLSTAIGALYGS